METGRFLVAGSWKEPSFHDTLLDRTGRDYGDRQ